MKLPTVRQDGMWNEFCEICAVFLQPVGRGEYSKGRGTGLKCGCSGDVMARDQRDWPCGADSVIVVRGTNHGDATVVAVKNFMFVLTYS